MRFIRTAAALLGLTAMLLAGTVATAQAAPQQPAPPRIASDVTLAAWDCPSGDLCVWDQVSGTGRRCNWKDADNDWWNTPVVCSWARNTPVRSLYNNGTSSRYTGVALYRGANHTYPDFCAPQGTRWNVSGGVILRSHKWITGTC